MTKRSLLAVAVVLVLVAAGNETTRHTISHGLVALLEHPAALAL